MTDNNTETSGVTIPICNICYEECPVGEPHPGMCMSCRKSYRKAVKYDPTNTFQHLTWAATVAHNSAARVADLKRFKARLQAIAAERDNNPSIDSTRRLSQEEMQINSQIAHDAARTDWRDDPAWAYEPPEAG